jgi:hypothetical protein
MTRARSILLTAAALILFAGGGVSAGPAAVSAPAGLHDTGRDSGGVVDIEFYYERGCDDCARVRREILPELEIRHSGGYRLLEYDIAVGAHYIRLSRWLNRLGIRDNAPVLMVVDGREALAGFAAIRDGLMDAVDRAVVLRLAGRGAGGEAGRALSVEEGEGEGVLRRHVAGFTLAGIVAAAVVDSFNPCMMAALVFFMSVLSVSHMGVRKMAWAGGAYVAACYVTYYLLGLGLFGALRALTGVLWIRRVFEGAILMSLAVFATLSFLDAARYRRTGRGESMSLRLPDGVQRRIHEVMKRGLRRRHLVAGGLGIGFLVTLMESLCTGQVYVPALALMIKSGQSVPRCALYLGLYNAIFVMPLAVLLVLTCLGLGTPALVEWSRRNVVFSKVSLGLFFTGLAVMMAALR